MTEHLAQLEVKETKKSSKVKILYYRLYRFFSLFIESNKRNRKQIHTHGDTHVQCVNFTIKIFIFILLCYHYQKQNTIFIDAILHNITILLFFSFIHFLLRSLIS